MTDDKPDNVSSLVERRAQMEADDEDEGEPDFDASRLVSVVDEGEGSFVLVSLAAGDGLEPDECDELALALVRAGVRVRMLRGET